MRCLVTGAAGFIGSWLCEALCAAGHDVSGLDAFIPYYPRPVKEDNLRTLREHPRFTFHEADLRSADLPPLLDGMEAVYHLGGMPGLLASWTDFDLYMTCNIQATHRLLEAARIAGGVRQFLFASTSSVYGSDATGPETAIPHPVSPYGITKLAAEHLVRTYDAQFDLPTTILRYFSVYGPRQRPDMGYHIFIDRILRGEPITVNGDGEQRRGSTYVADIVATTLRATERFRRGAIYNVGGSDEASANEIVALIEEITGREVRIMFGPARPGEQQRALADTTLAREELGYAPATTMRDGLTAQVAWQREQLATDE